MLNNATALCIYLNIVFTYLLINLPTTININNINILS